MKQTITVSDIAVLDIKPGQVLVLTVPERIKPRDTEDAMRLLAKVIPGVNVFIMQDGCVFSVIDRSEVPLTP